MQKQTEKQQLASLKTALEMVGGCAHKLIFDGNGFVLEDRLAGANGLDEFLLVNWLDETLFPLQSEIEKRLNELKD